MTIHEKLSRLTKMCHKAAVATRAGLSPATLSSILTRKAGVSITSARSLARVLCVDVGWLIDDSRGWPPVRTDEPADPEAHGSEASKAEESRTIAAA